VIADSDFAFYLRLWLQSIKLELRSLL